MKQLFITLGIICGAMVLTSASCGSNKKGCANVICTEIFMMESIVVVDAQGKAVALDEHYTVMEGSNERIMNDGHDMVEGRYVVLSDMQRKNFTNSTKTFYFKGFKDGKQVVNERFVFSADCCHIAKKDGVDTFVIAD